MAGGFHVLMQALQDVVRSRVCEGVCCELYARSIDMTGESPFLFLVCWRIMLAFGAQALTHSPHLIYKSPTTLQIPCTQVILLDVLLVYASLLGLWIWMVKLSLRLFLDVVSSARQQLVSDDRKGKRD